MYQNSPRKIVENFGLKWSKYKNQVLGGETAMWSEQVKSKMRFEIQFIDFSMDDISFHFDLRNHFYNKF